MTHDDNRASLLSKIRDLESINAKLRREVTVMREAAERHNRTAYATGLIVNCTGCVAGGPANPDDVTEDRIKEIERLAARLRTWMKNKAYRERQVVMQ